MRSLNFLPIQYFEFFAEFYKIYGNSIDTFDCSDCIQQLTYDSTKTNIVLIIIKPNSLLKLGVGHVMECTLYATQAHQSIVAEL